MRLKFWLSPSVYFNCGEEIEDEFECGENLNFISYFNVPSPPYSSSTLNSSSYKN